MNLDFTKITRIFTKKLALQMYFIFFILINILDFFNFLSGDVDFFKKILSWILIGYVFYKASFSKIFVGVVIESVEISISARPSGSKSSAKTSTEINIF